MRADVFSNVPEAGAYAVAYELDIPENGTFQGATAVPYTANNSATVAPRGFDRVAYYLELTNGSGTTWVYASMDAFTNSVTQTGLPHAVNNPVTFQQSVNNLEVYSNVSSVQTGTFDRGQIEMWHHTYTAANAQGVYAASASTDDWGDTIGGTASGYGSFQIHNQGSKQVVLAYNRWANSDSTNDDIGIGNSSGTHPDWTLAGNTATYTSRKLVVLVRPKLFSVTLTAFPKIQQVTPRNVTTNLATVPVSGTETLGGYDQAVLKILRNGAAYSTVAAQNLTYSLGSASFSFNPEIPAELASYTFELYLKQGTTLRLVRSVRDVTAGDVYLWYGQSNGEARKFNGSASAYSSPWIRTFGMNSDFANFTQASTFWTQADGDAYMEFPAGIGQWPLVVGRKIVDTYGIPVAILNGSRAAYNITRLQRDDANPDNLSDTGTTTYRVYNRLRYRAIQANVADKVRGIFLYQGESDSDDAGQHSGGFASLISDWQVDYPAVEKIFVSQVHVGCPTSAPVTRELPELRNLQRLFADIYPQVRIMSTNGLTTHTDDCHFPFTGGYETHGLNVFRQVRRDLYGAPDAPAIDPPNPSSVEMISGTRLRINLRKADAGITVDSAVLTNGDFRLNGSPAVLLSAAITSTAIELQYDRVLSGASSLDYLAHIGGAGGWVRNSNGVGLLAFSETFTNSIPAVTIVSPASVGVSTPGSQLTLQATGSTPAGTITRMDILVDGILHTSTASVSTIQTSWTVPASGVHQITFRATNSQNITGEKSIVVLTQDSTLPIGTTDPRVWLKPESGITRDGTGVVSFWQDASGNNNHCTQATTAAKPTYQPNQFGTMPGVVFDGGDWLIGATGMSTASYTKVVRVSMPDFSSPSGNIISSSATSGTRHALFMNGTAFPRMWHSALFVTSGTAMATNTGYIITATYDSTTKAGTLYLNGTQVGTGTAANNNADATYQLGMLGSTTTTTMRGSIGEVLIYNRVLTPTQRGDLETYLQNKSIAPADTPLTTYSSWSALNIPVGMDVTPTGDFNHNGVANLIEFALGLDPTKSGYPPVLNVTPGQGQVDVSYTRPTNRTGVTYELLESFDMQLWTTVIDAGGNVTGGIEARFCTRPLPPSQKAFYKLKVSMP